MSQVKVALSQSQPSSPLSPHSCFFLIYFSLSFNLYPLSYLCPFNFSLQPIFLYLFNSIHLSLYLLPPPPALSHPCLFFLTHFPIPLSLSFQPSPLFQSLPSIPFPSLSINPYPCLFSLTPFSPLFLCPFNISFFSVSYVMFLKNVILVTFHFFQHMHSKGSH